jgi:tape measure domain-containing protein
VADATLRIDVDTREANRALGSLSRSLQALATGAVVAGFIKLSDQATELRNRLNQVSTSTTQQNILFERLVQVANNARTPLTTTGDLFFRIARNVDALGISQNEALRATELVAKAISSSGISAQEASGPLLQLGQALQSGRLQGDELRSILEGLPPVAKAIADSLGVPIARLRQLGSEGKISSQQVIQAILAARDTIERDFAKTTPTIGQAFTVLTNNFTAFISVLDRSLGISKAGASTLLTLANAIQSLSNNIGTVVEFLKILGQIAITVFLFTFAGRIATALRAVATVVQRIGYFFLDFGKSISTITASFAKFYAVAKQQVLSVITQISGRSQALSGIFDFLTRAIFIPLNGVIRILASAFQNLHVVIGLAIGAALGFLDPVISRMKKVLQYIGLIDDSQSSNKKALEEEAAANAHYAEQIRKAMDEKKKVAEMLSASQEKFNKEFEKNIGQQEYELVLKQNSNLYTESQMQALLEINKLKQSAVSQEATLTQQQADRLRKVIEEAAAYERMAQSRRQVDEAGRNVITQVAGVADPRIAVEQEYINQQIALENYFVQNSLLTQEQYQQTLFQIEEQYRLAKYDASVALEERLRSIQQKTFEQQLRNQGFSFDQSRRMSEERAAFDRKTEFEKAQYAIEQGASVFESLGKYNKTAFQAAKAFNIANAIMNTYAGATKALATYPPPFNFIAAAAVVAGGMAQVAQIRAQQYSGRALGGPVMAGQSYIVGERGPEMFTPATSGGITPNNQLSDGSPVNINFNIQANDARGFDQLLAERRPMIINMVRTAMEDRGNKSNL